MSIEEFLDKLRSVKDQYKWTNCLGQIRGWIINNKVVNCFCPITATASSLTKKYYDLSDWREAGEKLSLPLEDAKEIVKAVHYTNPFLVDVELRKSILEVLEL